MYYLPKEASGSRVPVTFVWGVTPEGFYLFQSADPVVGVSWLYKKITQNKTT